MTETALAELLAADLSGLALMIDGVSFAPQMYVIVALGIGIDGIKHPLALVEGATQDATVATELLVGYLSAAWMSPARSWWASMDPGRCAKQRSMRWITRRSSAAKSTRLGM